MNESPFFPVALFIVAGVFLLHHSYVISGAEAVGNDQRCTQEIVHGWKVQDSVDQARRERT